MHLLYIIACTRMYSKWSLVLIAFSRKWSACIYTVVPLPELFHWHLHSRVSVSSHRAVSPATSRLSVSPIRPVKSPVMTRKQVIQTTEVLPPWKQAGYVSESSYSRAMAAGAAHIQTSVTQRTSWESSVAMQQQVSGMAVKEVSRLLVKIGLSL